MPESPGSIRLPPAVRVVVADLPPLAERHANMAGLYCGLAAHSPGDEFPGGTIFESSDGGTTWYEFHSFLGEAIAGVVVGTMAGGVDPEFWDDTTVLTVKLDRPFELSSEPEEEVASGRLNWMLVGPEIIGFVTATLVGERTYELTRLLRGRRNTEAFIGLHAAGEQVLLLTPPSSVAFVETGFRAHLSTKLYKGVPFGRSTDDFGDEVEILSQTESMRPFSPILLEGVRDASGNLTIKWLRRTRTMFRVLGGVKAPYDDFGYERYVVEILNDARNSLIREIVVDDATEAEYTAAQQTTDFGSTKDPVQVAVRMESPVLGEPYGRVAEGEV